MRKLLLPLLIASIACASTIYANVEPVLQNNSAKQKAIIEEPFDSDPFFESNDSMLKEMADLQQKVKALMNSQFSELQKSLPDRTQHSGFLANNIQIEEAKDKLIYKIKLPKMVDKRVDVSAKNGKLIITSKMLQKITKQDKNSKSISYAQSTNSQSFVIPKGYDENSLATQLKEDNLIVILKKSDVS